MSLKNLGTEVAGQKDRGGEIIKSMHGLLLSTLDPMLPTLARLGSWHDLQS